MWRDLCGGGMSGWSLLVFVDHLCCNQYIVGRPDGTSDQLRCCHMLPLLPNVAASRLRCLWAS